MISLVARELVLGFGEFEGVFKFALPVGIGREREAFGHAPLGVELEQLVRHVAHLGFDARFLRGPGGPAEPIERRRRISAAPVFLHQVHARERHVQLGFARVFEQHEIALLLALDDLANTQKLSDAVGRVHHEVARLEIGQVGGEGGHLALVRSRLGDQFGGAEQILGPDEGDGGFGKHHAAADQPFHQVGARDGPGEIRALRQIVGRGFVGREAQLERNRVFAQDVGQALQLAVGRRKERHAMPSLHQVLGLGDGHLHVPLERERRPR